MMAGVTVRPAVEGDMYAVSLLEQQCFSHPWSQNELESCLKKGIYRFFAAEESGEIIGYAGMYFAVDEADIANIAVREDQRHRGVGRALLRALKDCARNSGMETMFLEVRLSNTAAVGLYEKEGFIQVGRRKDYYDKPTEDALLYSLKFSEKETE